MSGYEATSTSKLSCLSHVSNSTASQDNEGFSDVSGYIAGDEAGLLWADADFADMWGSGGALVARTADVQILNLDLVIGDEVNGVENLVEEALEEVGDSDDLHHGDISNLEIGEESDSESMTNDERDEPAYEEVVSNLKRRRVYAYSPVQRARL